MSHFGSLHVNHDSRQVILAGQSGITADNNVQPCLRVVSRTYRERDEWAEPAVLYEHATPSMQKFRFEDCLL